MGGYLAFSGLDYNYFWDDEADTALFARNLLRFGKLTAWDGHNLIAHRNGSELNDKLITTWPPFQYLVTAVSFFIFGESTYPQVIY